MRYSDLRKKHGVGTVPKGTETDVKKTTKSKSSTDGNDYGSLLKKHGIDYNVDDNFVDTFIADANQFLVSAKDEYDSVGWRDATSAYETRHTARVDLDSRYFTMKGWLYSNRSNLEERVYKDFFNALNTYKAGADDILNAFRQKKEVAAKYDTEEAYNAAVEAGKEYYDTWGHYADEEDFDKYSAKGAAIPNPSYGEAQGFAIGPWRFGNDVVGNIVTFSRDNYNEIISGSEGGKYEVVGNYLYQHLTEDEANIYNYLLGKEHYDEAEAFLLDMEEKLKNREGERIGMLLSGIDIPVLEDLVLLGYGFGAGLDQWGNGVRQLFTAEKLSPTVTQYASAEITDSLDGFGKHAYSAATTVGNMAPSILATYLSAGLGASATVTQAAGAFTMGASAAGNAYASALNDGYSKEQAKAYGFLVGASEGVLQYLLGGIGELGGVSTSKIMSKVATIDKSLLRIGAKLGVGIGSEIVEEEVQNFLEPAFRTIIFGEEYDAPTIDEMIETAIVTAMSTFAMEGPSTVSHDINNSRYYSNAYGDVQQELVAQSLDLPEGSLSNGLGQKYQRRLDSGKNLNGHQLGRLVEANEQQFRIEDITKIQSAVEARLTKLGATGDVRAIAAVLAKQAAGENLSHAEKRLIAKSKPGQQVASELDPANIRAGTTDSAWVQNIGTERINAAEYNSAFAEGNTQQTQANSTLADPSLSLRTSPQTGVAISGESSVAPTTQQALAVEKSRENILDFSRTYDRIREDGSTRSTQSDREKIEETQHAEATRQKRAETVNKNRISGQAFEDARFSEFEAISQNLEKQITIKVGSIKVRVDAIGYIRNEDGTYSLQILEFKSTKTARMTKNQRKAFPKIAKEGGVVVGKGKGIFTEGRVIPPGTVVTIIRGTEGGNWYVSDRFG